MNRLKENKVNSGNRDAQISRFIAVLSGKGGVGKSVVAFNLAERLAANGHKVLLIDTDYRCGNLHLLANVNCDYGLKQFIDGMLSLKEAVTRINTNLDLLPTTWNEPIIEDHDTMSNAKFMEKLREQNGDYDFVILDQSSGVSNQAVVTAHACDMSILVLVPEVTSIADCYGLFKLLVEANSSINCQILANRIASVEEEDYIREKFTALTERFLLTRAGFLGSLPETAVVRQAVARQKAMHDIGPDDPAVQKLNTLVGKLKGSFHKHPVTSVSVDRDKKTLVTSDI